MTEFTQGHNEANDWIRQGDVNVYLSVLFMHITHTKPYKRLVTPLIDNAFLWKTCIAINHISIPSKIMLFYRLKGTVVHYLWVAATDITFTGIEEIAWFGPLPWAYHWILRLKKKLTDYYHDSLSHNLILTTLDKKRIAPT